MKRIVAIAVCLFIYSSLQAQYYLRGEIKDELNRPVPNAKILQHSSNYVYYSGSGGGFGISTSLRTDSFTISADGFQTVSQKINATDYANITLKTLASAMTVQKQRLLSVTRDLQNQNHRNWAVGGETYSSLVENEFVPAGRFPVTGFALNIDKASYSNIRRFLGFKTNVPPDAVRIEEMLNYFDYGYEEPEAGQDFRVKSQLSQCPWNPASQLLYLNISARKIPLDRIPPSNLVFLIDVSGSMDLPNRLPLLKSAFKLLVQNLRAIDTVSIVVYGGITGVMLPPTSGSNKTKINGAIEELYPGGSTPGESGIRTAYRLAQSQFIKGGNNRVILATDGDFNVGQTSDKELEDLITQYRQLDIYLTCLGVGMGNYKDSKLEGLAKKGNGNFAYLDNEREAEKVLVKEFTQTLYAVADDVSMNVRFNKSIVHQYRLIGFDNKLNALSDSSIAFEGGEVGSGHRMLAIFEIIPTHEQSDAIHSGFNTDVLAETELKYKLPGGVEWKKMLSKCTNAFTPFAELDQSYRFGSAIALFGSLLRGSRYIKNNSWQDLEDLAAKCTDPNDPLQREFLNLIQAAKKIYGKKKRKDE